MSDCDCETPVVWDGVEKRRSGPMTLRELEDHIDQRIKYRLAQHAEDEARQINARFDELAKLLTSAFPGGDPEEHRRYHDDVMEYIRDRRELWRAVREKTITALIWAGLVGLGAAVWQYIKTKLLGG